MHTYIHTYIRSYMTAYMRLLVFTWNACECDCAVVLICTEYGLASSLALVLPMLTSLCASCLICFSNIHGFGCIISFCVSNVCGFVCPFSIGFPMFCNKCVLFIFQKFFSFKLCKSLLLFVSNVSVIQKRESLETKTNKHHDFEPISRCDTTRRR